jgi:pimeloyl-ACP methyl ester carboxylesterase
MEIINLPKTRLQYHRQGYGMPLVLLHGFPLNWETWKPLIPLLENDFDLLLPNLRGFGGSVCSDARYSLADMADDISDMLDSLRIEKAAIAGHSMGGYIALAFANTHPGRLLGLGLVATQVLPDSPERKESRYQTVRQVEELGLDGLAQNMADLLSRELAIQKILRDIMLRQPKTGVICALKALAERPDQTSTLKSINQPVIIVHGKEDRLIPVDRALAMKEINPGSILTVIPKAGHMPMMEKPVETASALRKMK